MSEARLDISALFNMGEGVTVARSAATTDQGFRLPNGALVVPLIAFEVEEPANDGSDLPVGKIITNEKEIGKQLGLEMTTYLGADIDDSPDALGND